MKKSFNKSKKLSRKDDFEIKPEFQGGTVGLELEWKGIGLKISNENGFTIGGGIGLAYIEYNTQGGGLISYLGGLYKIEVEKVGCSYVKKYYVAGQYTFTETQTIPECQLNDEVEKVKEQSEMKEKNPEDYEEDYLEEKIKFPASAGLVFKLKISRYFAGGFKEIENCGPEKDEDTAGGGVVYDFDRFDPNFTEIVKTSKTTTIFENPAYINFGVQRRFCDKDIGDSLTVQNMLLRDVRSGIITSHMLGRSTIPGTSTSGGAVGMHLADKPLFPTRYFVTSYSFEFEIDDIPLDKYWKKEDLTKPPMKNKCCFSKKDLKKLHRIYKVLAVDEMIDEGFSAPKRLIMEAGKGNYFADNYLKIIEFQVRMADHLGIHPIKPDYGDINLIKAGKQEVTTKTVNAHAAIKEILENSYKNNTGNEAILRILGAFGIALSQLLRAVTEGVRRLRETMVFLGVPLKDKEFKIKMPFNIQALYKYKTTKKKVGKKTVEVKEKVLNTDEKLETLLPKFVQNSEQTFLYEGYDDDEPNLIEQLNQNDISNIQ